MLLASGRALARESPEHADREPEDPSDLEEETFGTRGLVRTRAETVSFDAKERSVELAGDVRIDSPPFHLRSQHLKLTRTRYGIDAEGKGRLAFCPCLGTPVTIEFDEAIVAPPGELFLKHPQLEIYGVPVMYLPWFWMRGSEKVGLLPPDVAYRGQDGLYAGGGVHLPWKDRGNRNAIDLRGGGYVDGGFAVDVRQLSPTASTRIRFDRLPGARAPGLATARSTPGSADDGLLVDARGASQGNDVTVAWDVDLLRGRRGLAATTDLDAASRPWDRAAASGVLRPGGPIVAETGFRAVTRRGGDLGTVEASGPFAALRSSGALAAGVTYDATVEGGALRVSGPAASEAALRAPSITPDSVSWARAEAGVLAATTVGPLGASLVARGAGDVAAEGRRDGSDRAGTARLRLGAPLARTFDAETDPLVHVVEPFAEASLLHARGNAILGVLPGRGLATIAGTAPVADAGVATALGRWGQRRSIDLVASGGVAHVDSWQPIARARLSGSLEAFGAQVETAHVSPGQSRAGTAVVARLRVGPSDGPRALANVATRDGVDPLLARALTDAPLEAPGGFLVREGTTGGAGLVLPWSRALTTSAGVDVDATRRELVGARAGLELRDRCNCVTLRVDGSHRIGRSGVDVWLAIAFSADK